MYFFDARRYSSGCAASALDFRPLRKNNQSVDKNTFSCAGLFSQLLKIGRTWLAKNSLDSGARRNPIAERNPTTTIMKYPGDGGERVGHKEKILTLVKTYFTRFWVHSRSRLVSRATLMPSEKFERAPFSRRWARACSSRSSRCFAFS